MNPIPLVALCLLCFGAACTGAKEVAGVIANSNTRSRRLGVLPLTALPVAPREMGRDAQLAARAAQPHRRLLGQLPNNYGQADRAKIRIRNGCSKDVEVAVMFWYNTWGAPNGCTFKSKYIDTLFCVHYWLTVKAGETRYIADTGFSEWYYTVRIKENTASVEWLRGGEEAYNMRWQPCNFGSPGCRMWKREVGYLDVGGQESNIPTVACPRNVIPYHFWDVWYTWPKPANPASAFTLDATITVQKDPGQATTTRYYWSHFFTFTHKKPASSAAKVADDAMGYMGLQTWGEGNRGAIFSVWNGVSGTPGAGSPGAYCRTFSNEGEGYHCATALRWAAGVAYRFRVSLLKRVAAGDTFRGTVKDTQPGGKELVIGDIFVPAYYGSPAASIYFYEIYEEVPSCASFAPARAKFSQLAMTSGGKPLKPSFSYAAMPADYPCPGWVSLDVCGTTVIGQGPLAVPVDPNGTSLSNRC